MVLIWLMTVNNNLVGGFNHLEKYESQWEGWHPIYEMENKQCLKPPTSDVFLCRNKEQTRADRKARAFFERNS